MATLKTIKRRIASTKNTEKLTSAMKMISAVRLKKAQVRLLDARVYNNELSRILSEVIKRGGSVDHPLMRHPETKSNAIDLVVFTSNKGLCGAFNENLLKKVVEFIGEQKKNGVAVFIHVFGKKGRDYLKRNQVPVAKEYVNVNENELASLIKEEIKYFSDRFIKGAVDKTIIAYNKLKGAASVQISFTNLLPATPPDSVEGYGVDYIYEPARDLVVSWVVGSSISSNLLLANLESNVSELSARMLAMDMATKNADDLISALTTTYNKARQFAITRELIDIVGTVEALK